MGTANDTLSVVRAYHRGWTSKNFDEAVRLLAPDLKVEVPINDYPTPELFAEALVGFGGMVTGVELLSELGEGNEAMLLYDMDVRGLARLRVAEHFTVAEGRKRGSARSTIQRHFGPPASRRADEARPFTPLPGFVASGSFLSNLVARS